MLRIFEAGLAGLLTKPFPRITCRKAYFARDRLQDVVGRYYEARHDDHPDVAALTKGRANCLRNLNWTGMEIGKLEIMLPIV